MISIYYNPKCGTARKTLELIREKGFEPEIVEYLETPLNREGLESLVAQMGIPIRELARDKEPLFQKLNLSLADDDALFKAIVDNPILMNRPVVVTAKGARLCRPAELVLDLLP